MKIFVGLITKCNCLDVPGNWAVTREPALLMMFESSVFQGLSRCTPLKWLLAAVSG